MQYLVVGSDSPRYLSAKKAVQVLTSQVLPTFDMFLKFMSEKRILAGGCPVGERGFVFIMEASSNEELDRILHNIPVWGAMNWKVTPLEAFEGRAGQGRDFVRRFGATSNRPS